MKTKKYNQAKSQDKMFLTNEDLKFPQINNKKTDDFKMRTITSMRGNLDMERLQEYYNKCDSTWDGTSMNSGSMKSDRNLPIFDRDQIKTQSTHTITKYHGNQSTR